MRVTLEDVNESPPAFTMSIYTASIVEQSGADTSVLDVSNFKNGSAAIFCVFISAII